MGAGAAGLGRLGMGAASLGGNALGGMFSGMAKSGVAVARTIASTMQAQEAARRAPEATRPAIGDDDTRSIGFYSIAADQSITGGSDLMAIEDAQQHHELQLRMQASRLQDAKEQRKRDEIKMIQDRH